MKRKIKKIWVHFWWWIIYHGGENPIKLWKEEQTLKESLKTLRM